jgi:HK97 family phage prohead protease
MKQELETRSLELRAISDENGLRHIIGHAAVFNKPSAGMSFTEYVRPGAFIDAIKTSDARALFNHNSSMLPLGRQSAKTLILKEDETGLFFDITPPDNQATRDLLQAIDRGDIREASYGFIVGAGNDEWDFTDRQNPKRYIKKVAEIRDISPVVFAAFPDTTVALRSLQENEPKTEPQKPIFSNLEKEEDELYKLIMM